MQKLFLSGFALLVLALPIQSQQTLSLMPMPKQLNWKGGRFDLTAQFSVAVLADSADRLLFRAVNRMYQALNRRTILYLTQDRIKPDYKNDTARMLIRVKKKSLPVIGEDESYSLKISQSQVVLEANNTIGAIRGMQTFLQLLTKKEGRYYFEQVDIYDAPRFAWRGLMIDLCRHFVPLDVLERNIEAMEAVKMNVLHLHLTDNEGFRFESKVYPALQDKGSNGQFYTQSQLREVIAFAQDRGIVVIPEFDIPGHTKSWFAGYPELSSSPGPFTPGSPVDFKLNGQLNLASIMQLIQTAPFPTIDPTRESTYQFLDKLFAEVAALFPAPYIHIGADENNGVVWKQNPRIVEFMKKNNIPDNHALQAYFVKRIQQILAKYKKQTVAWEEAFSNEISGKIILQVWQNPAYIQKAISNANPILISQGLYLDLFMPAYIHYTNPLYASLSSGDEAKTLGGEGAQWTEIADGNNIETRIWPRAGAIAERLWSPKAIDDVDDMYRRLFALSVQLDELGLQHNAAYERALRAYANGKDFTSLKAFTDLLTPVKGYKKLFARFSQQPSAAYQTAPLGEVSDIIPVDPQVKWEFRTAVQSWLEKKDPGSEKIIIQWLTFWEKLDSTLAPQFVNSTQLSRVAPHARNLYELAKIGLDAIDKINKHAVSSEWQKEKLDQVSAAGKTYGETELAILPEIKSLVAGKMEPVPKTYSVF